MGTQSRRILGWSSYQLSASRLLGRRLSGPLSCSVVTEAHDPGQRMSLHPVLGTVQQTGRPAWTPSSPLVPSPVPRTPREKQRLVLPSLLCPSSVLLEGRLRSHNWRHSSPVCLNLAYSEISPHPSCLLGTHPTPTCSEEPPSLSLLTLPSSLRTPDVVLS